MSARMSGARSDIETRASRLLVARIGEHRRAIVGGALVIAAAVVLIVLLPLLRGYYHELLRFRASGSLAFDATFVALLLLVTLTSVFPASILVVLAGTLFGFVKGVALTAPTIVAGALVAFAFSRYFFHDLSRRLVAKAIDLDTFEGRLRRHGWRYALLLRLAPLAPFSLTSYALGLTPIGAAAYLLATLAGMPFLCICVYLGSVGGAVIDASGNVEGDVVWRLALSFTAATIAVAVVVHWLPRLARRLLPSGED